MNKLDLLTHDTVKDRLEQLAKIFPNCVVETSDTDGNISNKVDFELIRNELSDHVVDQREKERFRLGWPGKSNSVLVANSPIAKTLRPIENESVDFSKTRNLFIEGDNLDALKLLQESYLGRVKMIFIDPPYNTGSDFIYSDDFAESPSEYLLRSMQEDEEGQRLVANKESNGRFHSDWLSMIYPRLRLARNLLSDDGVIFISIDDHESHTLRLICDEIFGRANFYCTFVWQRRSGAMDSVDNVSMDHEYVLCYGKQKGKLTGIERTYDKYKNPDNDPRGPWISDNLSAGKAGGDVHYAITDPETGNEFYPPQGRYWPYNRTSMQRKIEEGRVIFPASAEGRPMLKRFKNEAKSNVVPASTWMRKQGEKKVANALFSAMNTRGTKEVQQVLGGKYFSHPKSTTLIKSLASQCLSNDDDIVLDFFAGSGTTAHAVMSMAAEQGKNFRFIAIQIPEECDEKSEAFKAGFKTISGICSERIRIAGSQIKDSNSLTSPEMDCGFRYFRVDTSNMKDVYYSPDAVSQDDLFDQVGNIKEDRVPLDLLFQVLLDWGVDLSLPIAEEKISDKTVFFVDENALAACFDTDIDEAFVKELAARKPLRAVFRDASYSGDSVKINVEQIFKLISPATELRSI